ncbi:MAG: hypothetical protein QF754_13710, partial [Alphaproteobacteria bacterium]|nr:hypothetical protein [Alphaproteobacteria bacterium]
AWVPRDKIARDLSEGLLRPLPLAEDARRRAQLHLYYRDREGAGPATLALAQALIEAATSPDEPARNVLQG